MSSDDKRKELLKWVDTIEKLVIRTISVAGWVKILIDTFSA